MSGTVDDPCLGICKIAPATGWCVGCGRSYDETRLWHRLPAPERAAIFAQLVGRLAEMGVKAPRSVPPRRR